MDFLEGHLGVTSEIVYHDLTLPYDQTIVDIRNGKITGRTLGGCGSNLGLEVIRGTQKNGDRYNYITHTKNGKILRSSTIYLSDDDGRVTAALCVNTDITDSVRAEAMLHQYNGYQMEVSSSPETPEFFASNVNELLDYFIQEAAQLVNVPVPMMSREDKIQFLSYLDSKGAFLITKSSEHVCGYLGISKYMLYSCLEEIRKGQKQK